MARVRTPSARRQCRLGTFVGRFGSREALCEKGYLSGMVGFVFADVEPFPVDIHFFLAELFGIPAEEPCIIAFLEFGERVFAGFLESREGSSRDCGL